MPHQDTQTASAASKSSASGRYLTIGLNRIDATAYGSDGTLAACENDARDMASLASTAGFTGKTLLTEEATSSAVLGEIAQAGVELQPGDIFVLTYSGHGGQVGDVSDDELDGLDETWCLFDRQVVDDELYALWTKFRPGVRIVVFSDSCHSGSVVRALARELRLPSLKAAFTALSRDTVMIGRLHEARRKVIGAVPTGVPKALPFEVCWANYLKYRQTYDSLQIVAGPSSKANVAATVLLISGCQDDQLALDGSQNGAFTEQLKHVWNGGSFTGNYEAFQRAIRDRLPKSQVPNYLVEGGPNPAFEAQRPFTI